MNVLITGTSSGVGRATALKYLPYANVYGLDVQQATISGETYRHYICDVSKAGTLPELPPMDTVINNAGVAEDSRAIAVNLEGYINVAEKYCFQPRIKSILNVGSLSSRAGLESLRYSASQGGRCAMTKWLALHLGNKYGARANCISLGAVETGFEPELYADERLMQAVANENILKRWIKPQEIAEWIFFVCEVNQSMTGQDILIDCGEESNYTFIGSEVSGTAHERNKRRTV